MKTFPALAVILVSLAVLLTGCSQPAAPEPTATQLPPPTETAATRTEPPQPVSTRPAEAEPMTPADPVNTPSLSPGLEGIVKKAVADLAARLSIPEAEILLVEAREVVWPDASMGCPQPGMFYIQVPQDGALIILQAGDQRYEYHLGGKRGLFLCEKSLSEVVKPPKIDLNTLTPPAPDNSIPPGENQ